MHCGLQLCTIESVKCSDARLKMLICSNGVHYSSLHIGNASLSSTSLPNIIAVHTAVHTSNYATKQMMYTPA
jgi:hypothetical protein